MAARSHQGSPTATEGRSVRTKAMSLTARETGASRAQRAAEWERCEQLERLRLGAVCQPGAAQIIIAGGCDSRRSVQRCYK